MVTRAPVSWFELDTSPPESPFVFDEAADTVIDGVRVSNQELIFSPEGESAHPIHHPRLLAVVREYAAMCRLAEVVFPIVSGYRSPRWQAAYYFPPFTRHSLCHALDLAPVDDWTIGQMSVIAKIRWREPGSLLQGIGVYANWLHIDIVPRKHQILWHGRGGRFD